MNELNGVTKLRPFHDKSNFPFLSELEVHWKELRDELLPAVDHGVIFSPQNNDLLAHGSTWPQFELFIWGLPVPANLELAPITAKLIEGIPSLLQAAVYILGPNSHILPHTGKDYNRLRAHLGLKCPQGCPLRVGAEICDEQDGKLIIFDDTFEHEAWNQSLSELRYVLHIDFVKPWKLNVTQENLKKYRLDIAKSCPNFLPIAIFAGVELDLEIREGILSGDLPRPDRAEFKDNVWESFIKWLNQKTI